MLEPLRQWTPEAAGHLLARFAFGGSRAEANDLHRRGLDGAIEVLFGADDEDLFPAPEVPAAAAEFEARQRGRTLPEPERREVMNALQRDNREGLNELRAWWLDRMRWSPAATREKAVLFWHGHWATSFEKVKDARALWVQNETLRRLALGRFQEMAKEISRDPAMMRYLDLQTSRPEHPNENFARELMELFTLGEGHYTEADIRELARAFTGYRIRQEDGSFVFQPKQHDSGPKTFFGRTGPFEGDDIIEILTQRPECAHFLARKLWLFYAGTQPSPPLADALSRAYQAGALDTGRFLRLIARSTEFHATAGQQVKSPVHWLVSSCRMLGTPIPGNAFTEPLLRQLGQVPFAPPNVKGWDGGRAWITSSTLLTRYNAAAALLDGTRGTQPASVDKILPAGGSPEDLTHRAAAVLFLRDPDAVWMRKFIDFSKERGDSPKARRDLLHLMMSTPEFQLT